MKHGSLLCSMLLLVGSLFAAPPTSLQGLVYRDWTARIQSRTTDELSLDFTDATQFRSILWWEISDTDASVQRYFAPIAGSYTYEKTAENEYRVVVTEANGTTNTVLLTFKDDISGTCSRFSGAATEVSSYGYFSLRPRPNDMHRVLAAISTGAVAKANDPLIVGFVIPTDSGERDVLIRVVGPGLAQQGITDYWPTPTYYLPRPRRNPSWPGPIDNYLLSGRTGSWSSSPEAQATAEQAFARAGAFPLTPGSRDLADVARLPPGAYTVVVLPPPDSTGGTVLVEVYEL